MEMPVYVCSHLFWWITACKLDMFFESPLIGTLGLKVFLQWQSARFWLSRVALVCATQQRVVLCRYSEHCPNVGHLSILRKSLVRPLSPKRDGGGHTSENRAVKTYAYTHIT